MFPTERERLRSINRFDQLVAYLRDELDWPIDNTEIEEITYDYTPEELGIDRENAAKIESIKQLMPLSTNQPWGIFFIKFERKRLPVVALRRILRQLVIKKRTSSNYAEQPTWNRRDLLFISSYGEETERQISFAHFTENVEMSDLPVLKVLGWDGEDTNLHLDDVAEKLHQHLRWPNDESDLVSWRESWSSAFVLMHREVITTSKLLALRLADLAKSIRRKVNATLEIESENGPLTTLLNGFKEAMIHDLTEDDFADMYAQTITYGLLSARVSRPAGFVADNVVDMFPITNPFLKELMETFLNLGGRRGRASNGTVRGLDFDELGINDVVDLLRQAKMEAVLRDFGNLNPQEDPVIRFYEDFLKEYDAQKRMQRGVFYTPKPVVSFIVRSVDELLRKEFGLEYGLADTTTWGEIADRNADFEIPKGVNPNSYFVQILDPATGTGTFLVEVIDIIYETMREKWLKQGHLELELPNLWNEYVPKHLLTRIYGYELLMAPYSIAHMKIGLKLHETGYQFGNKERLRICLTNSLEPAQDFSDKLAFEVPALAHEAEAVNEIKRKQRFTIIIGNPPYSNFGQLNKIGSILDLLKDYKHGLEEIKINLDDDFIKFICFSHHLLDEAGIGIFGMITNNIFIDGITHRRMRESILLSFDEIHVLDLHGSTKKLEKSPDGTKDENVFDIQQGVGISILSKQSIADQKRVSHSEFWGSRNRKYHLLSTNTISSVEKCNLAPEAPYFFFVPKSFEGAETWNQWISISELMPVHSTGVKTHLDSVFVGFSNQEIKTQIEMFIKKNWQDVPPSSTKRASPLRKAVLLKQALSRSEGYSICDYSYRALDERKVAYIPLAIEAGDHRFPIMRHIIAGSPAILTTRQLSQGYFNHVLITRSITDMCVLSTATKECAYVFPLKVITGEDSWTQDARWNLNSDTAAWIKKHSITNKDVFNYIYAVLHSPTYQKNYLEFLKIDFPRLPLTPHLELVRTLAQIGGELISLHLMESSKLDNFLTTVIGSGEFHVEKISYSEETIWLNKVNTQGFRGVQEEVWNFRIGGYQVCEKWLKDRAPKKGKPGRELTEEDIKHYQKIIVAISETILSIKEIDEVIEKHGGWPNAFITEKKKEE